MKTLSGIKHIAWLIAVTLALGVLPAPIVPALLGPLHASPAEHSQPENSREEQADVESLKAVPQGRRSVHVSPTRAWLVLRVPRPSEPRSSLTSLSYEDPRRVLLPLRLDPPPDGLA